MLNKVNAARAARRNLVMVSGTHSTGEQIRIAFCHVGLEPGMNEPRQGGFRKMTTEGTFMQPRSTRPHDFCSAWAVGPLTG